MSPKADDSRSYFDPEVLSELRGLQLRARRIMEGLVAGLHKSPFQGFSVEFAEHREYAQGDDFRHIDWRVFGRTDRFYVRTYEQETNFDCYLLVDSSESMQFRSDAAAITKFEYAQLVSTALSWLVLRQRDAAGVAVFDEDITELLPTSTTPAHLQRLVDALSRAPCTAASRIGASLHAFARRVKRRAVVIVLSDLFEDAETIAGGLKHLRHAGHDVSLLQIVDPVEEDFPFDSPTLFRGLEHMGDHSVDPRSLARAYREEFAESQRRLRYLCRRHAADHTLVRSTDRVDQAVAKCLRARQQVAGSS